MSRIQQVWCLVWGAVVTVAYFAMAIALHDMLAR